MITFERMDVGDLDWGNMGLSGEINVFQTLPWISFVAKTQKAEPVVAAVRSDGRIVGYSKVLLSISTASGSLAALSEAGTPTLWVLA